MKKTTEYELGPHELKEAVIDYMKKKLEMEPDASVSSTLNVSFHSLNHEVTHCTVSFEHGKAE